MWYSLLLDSFSIPTSVLNEESAEELQICHLWPSLRLCHLDELSPGSVVRFKQLQTVTAEGGHQVQSGPVKCRAEYVIDL